MEPCSMVRLHITAAHLGQWEPVAGEGIEVSNIAD